MQISITPERLADLTAWLRVTTERVTSLRVPLDRWAKEAQQVVLDSFNSGGGSLGIEWPALAETTIERWGEHDFGSGPTGNLIDSIQPFVRDFVAGVESTAPHAHLFENGTHAAQFVHSPAGKVHIRRRSGGPTTDQRQPGRQFMAMTPQLEDRGIQLIVDYILGEGDFAADFGEEAA